jgi:hypothetical protein
MASTRGSGLSTMMCAPPPHPPEVLARDLDIDSDQLGVFGLPLRIVTGARVP